MAEAEEIPAFSTDTVLVPPARGRVWQPTETTRVPGYVQPFFRRFRIAAGFPLQQLAHHELCGTSIHLQEMPAQSSTRTRQSDSREQVHLEI